MSAWSRTPHRDRYEQQLAETMATRGVTMTKPEKNKRRKFMRKVSIIKRQDDFDVRRKNMASFLSGHEHSCIVCLRKYNCMQACDPVGEGLKTSLCNPCFERERHPC